MKFKKIALRCLMLAALSFAFSSAVLAGSNKSDEVDSQRTSFFSQKFSQRFNLAPLLISKNWSGTIAVSIEKQLNVAPPACRLNLYLGDDVNFKYPQTGDYTNFSGKNVDRTLFFIEQMNNDDARYITKNILKGSNKLILKVFNSDGEIVAINGLTIDTVNRNIVKGLHLIKTHPIMCDIFQNKKNKVKLIFLDSVSDGEITRSHNIGEYIIPWLKN